MVMKVEGTEMGRRPGRWAFYSIREPDRVWKEIGPRGCLGPHKVVLGHETLKGKGWPVGFLDPNVPKVKICIPSYILPSRDTHVRTYSNTSQVSIQTRKLLGSILSFQ
ncbi:hypothetical protein Droror1_Dr00017941 [Drosera rotundifolia]